MLAEIAVVADKPGRTAQAKMERHFTHMHLTLFNQNAAQILARKM